MDLTDEEGNTALHYACEKPDKHAVLFLLMQGVDPNIKNKNNKKAGEGIMEIKTLLNNIIAEEKAFKAL